MPQDGFGGNKRIHPLNPEHERTLAGSIIEGALIGSAVVVAGVVAGGVEAVRNTTIRSREQLSRIGNAVHRFTEEATNGLGPEGQGEPVSRLSKIQALAQMVGKNLTSTQDSTAELAKYSRIVQSEQPISYQRRRI